MLTQGEDVEAHALTKRGWSISAIARHLGRDRKTVRAYLSGERGPRCPGQTRPRTRSAVRPSTCRAVRRRPARLGLGAL